VESIYFDEHGPSASLLRPWWW